jgi:hypothetical protein
MHSRSASITATIAIVVIGFLPIFWQTNANATTWFDGQEILVECPAWEWEASPIFGVEYELCFDDVDQCTVAEIGDSVCIPSLGVHDVWVTAIDFQGGEPIYYDGDIISISREGNSDFTGDGAVGFGDFGQFIVFFGETGGPGDLDGDGLVGFLDFAQFASAFGKCINAAGTLYESC